MKQIVFLAVILFLVVVIVNLTTSLLSLWSKKDVLTQTKNRLVAEQQENARLKQQLQQVSTASFIEEQARDKLFMGKPGDVVVLFAKATQSAQTQGQGEAKPIWQQWLEVFFQ